MPDFIKQVQMGDMYAHKSNMLSAQQVLNEYTHDEGKEMISGERMQMQMKGKQPMLARKRIDANKLFNDYENMHDKTLSMG